MIVYSTNRTLLMTNGAIAVILGVLALLWPGITAQVLTVLIGLFLLADAVMTFFVRNRGRIPTWSAIAQGIVGLLVPLLIVLMPEAAVRIVIVLFALWIMLRGVVQLTISWGHRSIPGMVGYTGMAGLVSLLVGILLLTRPEAGIVAFSWLLGIYAIVTGGVALLWGYRAGAND